MVFSEPTFLYFFLPVTISLYFFLSQYLRDFFLFSASVVFYAWGEDEYVLVMLTMILINYLLGFGINSTKTILLRRILVILGVSLNLSVLIFFKYAYFIASSITSSAPTLEYTSSIHLPIGISFFIFQSLTYLVDLYRGGIEVQKNPIKLGLYISLFPQLIAGPIVRYSEIEKKLVNRKTHTNDFVAGTQRFVIGLAKKIWIADPLGLVADQIFAVPNDGLSTQVVWLGVVCYSFQIFFDFSAYSDMAIGLGRVFGFNFPENFNYPYISQSITEFWRRWHMTLSRWFRDYLYIPLGGNRCGNMRTYINLFVVFILCGLWHGASWNFAIWGFYYGVILSVERAGLSIILKKAPKLLRHGYVLLMVMIGWVPFRAESWEQTQQFLWYMFVPSSGSVSHAFAFDRFVDSHIYFTLMLGVLFSMPVIGVVRESKTYFNIIHSDTYFSKGFTYLTSTVFMLLMIITVIASGASSYSPFIYFRF